MWYPASSCGSPNSLSQAPAAKCIQSSSNCNTWLPQSSLRQQLRLESQLHLLGWRSNCLACDLYQLMWYSGWGPVQAESKPLSRTSWEFWCLHPEHHSLCSDTPDAAPGLGSLQCHHGHLEEAGCLGDHQQNQGGICIVWDTHLT